MDRETGELQVLTYSGTTGQISTHSGTAMSARLPDALKVPVTIGPIVSVYDPEPTRDQRQTQPVQIVNQEPPRNVETTVVTKQLRRRESGMKVAGTCFAILKWITKIIWMLPRTTQRTVIQALVTLRLDYGNVLLLGATKKVVRKFQVVQNMAAAYYAKF